MIQLQNVEPILGDEYILFYACFSHGPVLNTCLNKSCAYLPLARTIVVARPLSDVCSVEWGMCLVQKDGNSFSSDIPVVYPYITTSRVPCRTLAGEASEYRIGKGRKEL